MTSEPRHPEGDDQLLRRFLAGDREAVRTVEGWARAIVRFRPYGIPRAEHGDVVQQSIGMLWAACSRPGFALRHGLRALVRRIVLARCVDHLRRVRPSVEVDDDLADPGPGLEERALERERRLAVRRALLQLDDRCREVIRLHYLDGIEYATLATRLGIAASTVRVRMFHCMKEVRRLISISERAETC